MTSVKYIVPIFEKLYSKLTNSFFISFLMIFHLLLYLHLFTLVYTFLDFISSLFYYINVQCNLIEQSTN